MAVPLQIAARRVGDVTFLALTGRLVLEDGETALRDRIDALIREGRKQVVLDLHGLTYIDSCGIGTLVSKCVSLRKVGGDLKLLCPTQRCLHMLEVTGLVHAVFDVYQTEDEALSAISSVAR